jgi:hypothetical protein
MTFSHKCTIIFEADNGDLEDYPATEKISFEFDTTDAAIGLWITQFRKVLSAVGFAENSINKYLGNE